ncbi:aspartate carbamoyltransferase [Carnobacterium alterfunditum]|uniref:Aspartate carbamoyltransferase n=1 Tax=Carnobacterium alterfunditum TaxID=28230 RepID=A0A1N6H2C3_9LACT|nr:aspartate carbamoyltransferase catalytic subunit [Carnobacterium alterfunditum]SIO13943.1 aspartate carbamoyltransferase [Carnobacterium alterfunditum]
MEKIYASMALDHFISVEALTNEEVLTLIKRASQLKKGILPTQIKEPLYAVNLFFENSTRTHKSFEMAEKKLGIEIIDFEPSTSSIKKGESLYDTVLTMSALGTDIAVIRDSKEAFYTELIESSSIKCAIINGGDGTGQHPSQCLLDLMTIYEEYGHFDGLKIAIVGDLKHSRVAKSNMTMLKRLGAEVFFSGPDQWIDGSFSEYGNYLAIDDLVSEVDVVMLLRVQHERHETHETVSIETYLDNYGLNETREKKMKPAAIIMHPAPVNRDVELESSLVECDRSRIVTQMSNGVYARMAILEAIIAGRNKVDKQADDIFTSGDE